MEPLTILAVLIVLGGLYMWAQAAGWLPERFNRLETLELRVYKKALSKLPCPSCGQSIGEAGAKQALEQAWETNQQGLMTRVAPEFYESWPVVCPACSKESTFWTSEKLLRKTPAGQ